MLKTILLFIYFWLPAMVAESILYIFPQIRLQLPETAFFIVRLLFAFILLLGWAILVNMLSYKYPAQTFGGIFIFFAMNVFAVYCLYSGAYFAFYPQVTIYLSGIFSYTPLKSVVELFAKMPYPGEATVLVVLLVALLSGWVLGRIRFERSKLYFS